MIGKLKTGLWFLRNPRFWAHAGTLVARKLTNASAHERRRGEATAWAAERAVSPEAALTRVGLYDSEQAPFPIMSETLMLEAESRAASARVSMGGPADLILLYAATILGRPNAAVETGVAYGWSSLAILAAMERNGVGQLVSVDMPYAKLDNEPWVGCAVAEELKGRWTLIREPDRNGLKKAIALAAGPVDLCHYDSDKSYRGRLYAYPLMWDALRPGGLLISDDIQDNFGFRDFCEGRGLNFQVTSSAGKFVGIVRKPLADQ